jgi:hypothetical protein
MKQLDPSPPVIDEASLQDAAAHVRGLVARRLETVWQSCAPHLQPVQLDDGTWSKPDPRFLEAGIRVLDRMMRLYRLDAPGVRSPDEVTPADAVVLLESALRELEARLRG